MMTVSNSICDDGVEQRFAGKWRDKHIEWSVWFYISESSWKLGYTRFFSKPGYERQFMWGQWKIRKARLTGSRFNKRPALERKIEFDGHRVDTTLHNCSWNNRST